MRPSPLPLFVLLVLPLPGCCSLSRFFCGPDTTPWVSVRFETPRLAVQTLLEALRRDDPEIVCLCLSQDHLKRLEVNVMTFKVAWPRIREENPGLHVAGYAKVPEPTRTDRDHAHVTIDVYGRKIEIQLVREARWAVRYQRPDGTPGEPSAPVASFEGRARIEVIEDPEHERSRLVLEPFTFEHEGLPKLALDDIEYAALSRAWKIANVSLLTPP